MKIIKANKTDLESIVNLNKQFHLDFPWFKWDTIEWVEETIDNGDYYVMKDNDVVIGSICLKTLYNVCDVETIAVQKDKHKSGVGRELIEFAIEFAKKEGKNKLNVGSFCEYGTKGFYEKCGFITESKLSKYRRHPYYRFSMDI